MRFLLLVFLLTGSVVFGQNSRSRIQDNGNRIQDAILEEADRQEEKDRQKEIAKFNKDVDAAMVKLVEAKSKKQTRPLVAGPQGCPQKGQETQEAEK